VLGGLVKGREGKELGELWVDSRLFYWDCIKGGKERDC